MSKMTPVRRFESNNNNDKKWTCASCTYFNDNSSVCAMCHHPRPSTKVRRRSGSPAATSECKRVYALAHPQYQQPPRRAGVRRDNPPTAPMEMHVVVHGRALRVRSRTVSTRKCAMRATARASCTNIVRNKSTLQRGR
jgi:hypothetical protein